MMRFDKEALFWDEKPRRVELGKAVSEYVNKFLNIESEVLDFGCGTGLVSLNFCNKVKNILGVDLSCEMVKIYNEKSKKIDCNSKAICEDVINVNKKFDIIVGSMVFHHIENIDKMLEILSLKLKKGGDLFIADLYEEDGTFHTNGNDDVFHFGFHKDSFKNKNYKNIDVKKIYTVKKHKNFDISIWHLKKIV